MRLFRPRRQLELAKRVREWADQGHSAGQVAAWLGVKESSVRRYLERVAQERQVKERRERGASQALFLVDRLGRGLKQVDIARELGVTRQYVSQLLRNHGLRGPRDHEVTLRRRERVLALCETGLSAKEIAMAVGCTPANVANVSCRYLLPRQRVVARVRRAELARKRRDEVVDRCVTEFEAGRTLDELVLESGYSVTYLYPLLITRLSCLDDRKRCRTEFLTEHITIKTLFNDTEVVRLYESGRFGPEIARELGCSVPLVYKRLRRLFLLSGGTGRLRRGVIKADIGERR